MVRLRGPNPDPPEQGEEFTITADDGEGPFEFKWKIGDNGDWEQVEQENPKLKIEIPPGTRGQRLFIEVVDAAEDEDAWSNLISD